jgi:23S rRNA pseudouridine1911/1915/1917 synthase
MLKVVYSDNHILVVDKPAGIPTQGGLDELAKAWIKKTCDKPGNVFLEPVHRLDKPVSGLVLFARTSKALSRLNELIRERQIVKIYYAYVEGQPKQEEGTLKHTLLHDEYRARVVPADHPEGKSAILNYRVLDQVRNFSFVEISLHTGRYHQIRAQFAAIGCPIAGDDKYGASLKRDEIALRHSRMEFIHPVTKQPLILDCGKFIKL